MQQRKATKYLAKAGMNSPMDTARAEKDAGDLKTPGESSIGITEPTQKQRNRHSKKYGCLTY